MSRYKPILTGETELPEIDGIKFVIYPTVQVRMEILDFMNNLNKVEEIDEKDSTGVVKSTKRVKGGSFSITEAVRLLTELVWEGCYEHDNNGRRLALKQEEKDASKDLIKRVILEVDIMSLWLTTLETLKIIDSDKAKEIKKSVSDKLDKKN